MKMKFYSFATLAALAGLVTAGCETQYQPVYVAPPPTTGGISGVAGVGNGVVYSTPSPTGTHINSPAQPGDPQEPPPGTAVTASVPPPAPLVETPPPAPGPDYVYTPGYYNWNGVAWVWAPGVWVLPPYRGALWAHGGWVFRGGRHVWVGGRWR